MNSIDASAKNVADLVKNLPCDFGNFMPRTPYYNMAATLTDSVLQAGMNYKYVVYPRILNILNKYGAYRTTYDFIILFQTVPIEEIIQWKNVKKQNTICNMANFLYDQNLNTEDDLAEWISYDVNAENLLEINGIGRKTVDYLKVLCGLQAIPIDRHMFQFLEMAGIITTDYEEARDILKRAALFLQIGEATLDKVIWDYMSNNKATKETVPNG